MHRNTQAVLAIFISPCGSCLLYYHPFNWYQPPGFMRQSGPIHDLYPTSILICCMPCLPCNEWQVVYMHLILRGNPQLKPRSQLKINRAVTARFLPEFCWMPILRDRLVAGRIFLTLNKVVNSPSGHLTITAGRLFGHRPISSSNDQIFGRCPAGVPAVTAGSPVECC